MSFFGIIKVYIMTRLKNKNERTAQLLEFAYGDNGTSARTHHVVQNLSRLARHNTLYDLTDADMDFLPGYIRDFRDENHPSPDVRRRMAGYLDNFEDFAEPIMQLRRDIAEGNPTVLLGEGDYARVYMLHKDDVPYAVRIFKSRHRPIGYEDTYDLMRKHAEVADNDGFARLVAIDLESATSVSEYVGTSLYQLSAHDTNLITAAHFEYAFDALREAAKKGVSVDAHAGNVCYDSARDRLVHIDPALSGRHITDFKITNIYQDILNFTSVVSLARDYIRDNVRTPDIVAAYEAERHLLQEFVLAVNNQFEDVIANKIKLWSMLDTYGIKQNPQGVTLDG